MSDPFLRLVSGRSGHFRLESGYHSRLWLDLETLFLDWQGVRPFVETLATLLRHYEVEAVCGPMVGGGFLAQMLARKLAVRFFFTDRVLSTGGQELYRARYVLPAAQRPLVGGQRLAIVDDVVSAGSAVRGTCIELETYGATPIVVGALLRLGDAATPFFDQRRVPIESALRMPFDVWLPADCPLCVAEVPLEDVTAQRGPRPE